VPGKHGTWFHADGKAQAFNDLYEYEPGEEESRWTAVTTANPPPPRTRHAAFALDDNNLIVFGGVNKRDRYGDLWVYNCPAKTWTHVEAEGCNYTDPNTGAESIIFPGARAHFTAAKAFNRIFIFGGYGGAGIVYGDLWVLHLDVRGNGEPHFRYTGPAPANCLKQGS
jgi:dynein heavy chain, axonemal